MVTGEILESPCFFINTPFHKSKWRLSLYPKGKNIESSDYLPIYVNRVTPAEEKLEGKTIVSIIGEKKRIYLTKTLSLNKYNEKDYSWGWRKFVKISQLHDANKKLLVDDTLTICCELNVVVQHNIVIKEIETDLVLIQLQNKLGITCLDEKLSDVKIASSCGSEVPAHKFVLAAQSEVFNAMFSKKDEPMSIIETNCKLEAVKLMLRFVYAQEIKNDLNDSTVFDLLSLAYDYRLDKLEKMCEEFLEEKPTRMNKEDSANKRIPSERPKM